MVGRRGGKTVAEIVGCSRSARSFICSSHCIYIRLTRIVPSRRENISRCAFRPVRSSIGLPLPSRPAVKKPTPTAPPRRRNLALRFRPTIDVSPHRQETVKTIILLPVDYVSERQLSRFVLIGERFFHIYFPNFGNIWR